MSLTLESDQANHPAIQLLRAKLAHAFPNDALCPMHKEIISWHPDAVDQEWCPDTNGSVIYVVFNFQTWEMFEFDHTPHEVKGIPVIDVGEKVGLFVMDPVGREVVETLKSHARTLPGVFVEGLELCLRDEQTPAFHLVWLLVQEKVLGREVRPSEFSRRVQECETAIQLADGIWGLW